MNKKTLLDQQWILTRTMVILSTKVSPSLRPFAAEWDACTYTDVSMTLVFFKNIHLFSACSLMSAGISGSCSLTVTQRLFLSGDCTVLFLTGATLLDNTFQRRSLMLTPTFDIITSTEQSNPTVNWACIDSVTEQNKLLYNRCLVCIT